MSTNENKKEDQKPQGAQKDTPKAENSNKEQEYKGNNPGGAASKR